MAGFRPKADVQGISALRSASDPKRTCIYYYRVSNSFYPDELEELGMRLFSMSALLVVIISYGPPTVAAAPEDVQ